LHQELESKPPRKENTESDDPPRRLTLPTALDQGEREGFEFLGFGWEREALGRAGEKRVNGRGRREP